MRTYRFQGSMLVLLMLVLLWWATGSATDTQAHAGSNVVPASYPDVSAFQRPAEQQSASRGDSIVSGGPLLTLSGTVLVEGLGNPLPYSTVTVEELGRERFTDETGRFTYHGLSPGSYRIRVRQIGYLPLDTTVVLAEGVSGPVLALIRIPTQLAEVQVSAPPRRCIVPEYDGSVDDPELNVVLGEVRKNAEREQLLRRTYPFEYRLAQSHDTYVVRDSTHHVRHDTAYFRSDSFWRYRAGRIVSGDRSKLFGEVRVMRLPTLTDLADRTFLGAHCFKYAGVVEEEDGPTHRIDFEPAPEIRAPDVEGSIFLDSATYMIRRAEFRLTRGGSVRPPILGMTVSTSYREILPNVALFDEISSVQPLGLLAPGGSAREFRQLQRLISYRFLLNAPPGSRSGVIYTETANGGH